MSFSASIDKKQHYHLQKGHHQHKGLKQSTARGSSVMMMKNVFSLLYTPKNEWRDIAIQNKTVVQTILLYVVPMALIPTISAYIGASYVGWGLVGEKIVKLTSDSAMLLSIAAFFAITGAVVVMGLLIKWMAETYGGHPSLDRCIALSAYSATPLFLVGFAALYPVLWVDTLLTLVAIAFAVKLLFIGVPIMMDIDENKGYLFASSILTVAMVMIIGLFAITILFWGFGLAPAFRV